MFYLYQPFLEGEGEGDNGDDIPARLFEEGRWVRGRWWYRLAHVCRRWRDVILRSASYLGVSLVCTNGTPVADMLANSPPLPVVIEYYVDENDDIAAEDEAGAILALKQRDRILRVRLVMSVTNLQKLIIVMGDEYPILEYLIIGHRMEDKTSILIFPETLQAAHLRHLVLVGFTLPIGSRLLSTAVGLVTLHLIMVHPSTYFHPNTLLRWLSFMPQLESFSIGFVFPTPDHDVERQLTHIPIMTLVTLPNLHIFRFQGVRTYLEALVHQITTPQLEKLQIWFFNQLTVSVPCLLQFMNTADNLRFNSAKFKFSDEEVVVEVYPHEEANMYALSIAVSGWHLDWQVSSVAQISNSLRPIFSAVGHLTLEYSVHNRSSEEHNEANRTEWHKLLSSFKKVKTLGITKGLVKELSRCLQLDDGELSSELLPELQEITYFGSGIVDDTLTSFIDACQNAGRPITLAPVVHPSSSLDRSSSLSSIEPSLITPARIEAGIDFDT